MHWARGAAGAAICAALLAACRGGASSNDKGDQGSTSVDPSKLPLAYVCGNQFKVQNYYPSRLSVTWSVTNSGDQGTLSLPAPPAGSAFSETVFTTRAIGTVILASGGVQLNSAANQQVSCAPPPPVVHVAVTPAVSTVPSSGTQQFAAQVTGTADTAVVWTVQEGASGGAVDPTGLYTAPATAGTFHVVATSRADSTRSARINVTVQLPQPPTAASQLGQWDAPRGWPVVSTHIALLRDGRVLAWSRLGSPNIWDPSTDTFLAVPAPSWIFCAGQTFMPDGKLIVPGGHIKDDFGLPDVNVFDPATSSWIKSPPMADGRWYPTTIELADGSILVVAGDSA